MRPSMGQKVSDAKNSDDSRARIIHQIELRRAPRALHEMKLSRTQRPSHELSLDPLSTEGRTSYSSSAAPLRCSRRKGYTPHESLPPQGGTSAYRADANSLLREIPCHLDPEIFRPSPKLGAHRIRSRGFAGRVPVRSASCHRTPPVPVLR